MEKFALTLQSKPAIEQYISENHWMSYERQLMMELLSYIDKGDVEQLAWFAGFGDSYRQILMNVNEYRKGLEFGFTTIAFNQYGWFASPKFLDYEEIEMEKSNIRIGRGPNGLWAYALSINYGVAGSSAPLCVFCKKFPNRNAAMTAALSELKVAINSKIGSADRTNYHQDVLIKTLKAITAAEIGLVQLTLF
jgi:hypothetical protein